MKKDTYMYVGIQYIYIHRTIFGQLKFSVETLLDSRIVIEWNAGLVYPTYFTDLAE